MAYYYLTLKSDTKPDGSKVAATHKIDYVNRQGQYENIDEERMLQHDIFQETIYSSNPIENPPLNEEMLYESPFGSIKRMPSGEIKVSRDASIETVGIALTLAQNLYNGDIEIDGSEKFRARCLYTTADLELNIQFKKNELEKMVNNIKEEKNYVRRNLQQGPTRRARQRQLKRRNFRKRIGFSREPLVHIAERAGEIFTRSQSDLPNLSERDVDVFGGETPMLVQGDKRVHVRHQPKQKTIHPPVRWSLSRSRRNRIEDTANQIMENIQSKSDKIFASSHLQYINREAAFKKRGGCIATGHQLPKWAGDDPKVFFMTADQYSPVNDERYKEIIFALPNELSLDQQKELLNDFLEMHLKDHYYAWAIHDKIGTLDTTGEHHTHVHIMFSTKLIDDQERKEERPPEIFFKKANPKYPERGGPKKAEEWTGKSRREHLLRVREDYATLQNEALKKAGIPLRVDHRTKKVQYEEAMKQGFYTLAKMLEIYPEKYIDTPLMLNQDSKEFKEKQNYRNYKNEYIKKLQAADHLERLIEEEKVQERVRVAKDDFTDIVSAGDDENDSSELKKLKRHIIDLLDQEANLFGLVLRESTAIEQAQLSFMTPKERELFAEYRALKEEKRGWLQFRKGLKKPPAYQKDELAMYERMLDEVDSAIETLNKKIAASEKEATLRDALIRLSSQAMEKKVMNAKINLLNENKPIREKYYKLVDEIDDEMLKLQDLIDKYAEQERQESYEKDYDTKDLIRELYKERKILIKRLEKLEAALAKQEKKVFSLERAEEMAKDVFVKGEYKKLRKELRDLKKREGYYAADMKKLDELRANLGPNSTPDEVGAVQKEEARLSQMRTELDSTRQRLENRRADLDKRCSEPKAVSKIADITKGILNKNQGEKARRDLLAKKVNECHEKINNIEKEIDNFKQAIKQEREETRFHVGPPRDHPEMPFPQQNAPSIIVNALLGDEYCASFVYREEGGKEAWQRDWLYMSEADKDEARLRRAYSDDY